MSEVIHLVATLTYGDAIISDEGHRQVLYVPFIGVIQRDEGSHFPYIPGHPVEISGVMGRVKATFVYVIPHSLSYSLHGIHAWH
jgi:hypothetical protein